MLHLASSVEKFMYSTFLRSFSMFLLLRRQKCRERRALGKIATATKLTDNEPSGPNGRAANR
jgi:hypothetical protein